MAAMKFIAALLAASIFASTCVAYVPSRYSSRTMKNSKSRLRAEDDDASVVITPVGEEPVEAKDELPELTEKEKEIARLRAAETFMVKETGIFECRSCGFEYREEQQGTAFAQLPSSWRCPQCLSQKGLFTPRTTTIAGFRENQEYGFGTNTMTSEGKNGLIFGSLGVFFLLFLSGYLLE